MLEHVPAWLGRALEDVRAGMEKLAIVRMGLPADLPTLQVTSPAFAPEGRLPERFTADGPGVSPPLCWTGVPDGTASLALLVEDADAPAPQPLVHAVVWAMPAAAGGLAEGIIGGETGDADQDVGRNSYFREGWLPPDPPTGHGSHRYAFQLFAVGPGAGDPGETPGRGAMIEAITGHVVAAGVLIGTYSRGEEAPVGPVGAAAPA